jgi:hypothetical protein
MAMALGARNPTSSWIEIVEQRETPKTRATAQQPRETELRDSELGDTELRGEAMIRF